MRAKLIQLRGWCAFQEGYHCVDPMRRWLFNRAWRILCFITVGRRETTR